MDGRQGTMKKIDFVKAVGSGNDFIIIDSRRGRLPLANSQLSDFVRRMCLRKKSIGADGVLVLENSKIADVRMRVFNPDGGEVEMCGNGARCVALYKIKNFRKTSLCGREKSNIKNITIETKTGLLVAEMTNKNRVKLKMPEPKGIKLDFNLEVNGRDYKVSYINTGVPHIVLFIEEIDRIDVLGLGGNIRYHSQFQPAGTNVNFVEQIDSQNIRIRTYERGVEGETLACGTGAVASGIVASYRLKVKNSQHKINILTQSGETLRVYFSQENDKVSNVWLEGGAEIVYRGRMDYV